MEAGCHSCSRGNAWSNIISVIAIITSVTTALIQISWNRRERSNERELEIYRVLFEEKILKELPEACYKLSFEGEQIAGVDLVCNVLISIRKGLYFFKYYNRGFYQRGTILVQDFEDYLCDLLNIPMLERDVTKIEAQTDQYMKKICDMMLEHFV